MNRRKFISGIAGFCLGLQTQFSVEATVPKIKNPWMEVFAVGNSKSWPDPLGKTVKSLWVQRHHDEYRKLAGLPVDEPEPLDPDLVRFYNS